MLTVDHVVSQSYRCRKEPDGLCRRSVAQDGTIDSGKGKTFPVVPGASVLPTEENAQFIPPGI